MIRNSARIMRGFCAGFAARVLKLARCQFATASGKAFDIAESFAARVFASPFGTKKPAQRRNVLNCFGKMGGARMREFFPAYRVAHEVARANAPRELARAQTRPSAAIVKKKRQAKKAAGVASHAFKAKPVVDHKGRPGASQIHPDAAMALAVASRMRNKP